MLLSAPLVDCMPQIGARFPGFRQAGRMAEGLPGYGTTSVIRFPHRCESWLRLSPAICITNEEWSCR